MYLAILYCLDVDSVQTFTMSRPVPALNKKKIIAFLLKEAQTTKNSIDTILVVENGQALNDGRNKNPPKVVRFWTAANGDI